MNMEEKLLNIELFGKAKDYAFEYAKGIDSREVYPTVEALDNLKVFDEPLPETKGNALKIIEQLHQYGSPATVAQTGGRYFGLVNGGALPVGLAAKWLNDFWDQNTPLYLTSPIASKLEGVTEKWLTGIFGLPQSAVAGFVSGSSMAIFCSLAAARYRIYQKLGWDVNEQGLWDAPKIRIVAGKHAHGTVIKTLALLGFGKSNIEWVDVDEQGRIIPDKIPVLDERTILILQAGNVNSGSFDDFETICKKAQSANCWVHIDGAFGLWVNACEKLKHLTKGIEWANSWSVDAHKTLNTPYDSGIVLCNDREALAAALQASGSYILYGGQRDGMLYTPEMSRRARVVELWAVLKYLGQAGISQLVLNLNERALQFDEELKSNGFTILNKVEFNQILVACNTDEETDSVLRTIQEMRVCWCGGSVWFGRKVIRISVCSWATTSEDVRLSVQSFIDARNLAKSNIQ